MPFRPGRRSPLRRPGPLRRGPPLAGPRRAGRRVAAALLAQLDHAHRLLAEGHPAEAAPLFAELAQAAQSHTMPQRAAHLHLQAAQCYFQARDSATGLSQARAGLQTFSNAGMLEKARHAYARLLAGLRANNQTVEAEILQKEFGAQLGLVTTQAPIEAESEAQPRGRLPAKCSSCNGPIRSDEVDWIDEHSAECPYCGSTLQTQP